MLEKLVPTYIKEEVDKVINNTTGHKSYGALCGGVFHALLGTLTWLIRDATTPYALPAEYASFG